MPSHMSLIRYFISIMFDHRIKFWINHIPGIHNIEADNLSRFRPQPLKRLYTFPKDQYTLPFFRTNPNLTPNIHSNT